MSRIVVTGAGGFLGSAVVEALAVRGDQVTGFDVAPGVALQAMAARFSNLRVVSGEITEWQHVVEVLREAAPDAVIHLAAIVGVVNSLAAPFATMRVNIGGALNVLEAMRLLGLKRFINMSSEEIYGDFESLRITEDHPCRPVLPYGISKFAVEQLARGYVRLHGLECVHLRTCWVYGPGLPRPRIPKTFIDAALKGEPLHMATGGDFRVDQVYIDDLVAGVLAALDKASHRFDAYHIATGVAPSLREIVEIVKELVPDADLSIGPGPYDFGRGIATVKKGALDITRACSELGYAPKYDIRAGIAANVEATRRALGQRPKA